MESEIPYFDEDLDEQFTGPYNPEDLDELNESWDDEYEGEAIRLFQDGGSDPPPDAPTSDPGGGSAYTQDPQQAHIIYCKSCAAH